MSTGRLNCSALPKSNTVQDIRLMIYLSNNKIIFQINWCDLIVVILLSWRYLDLKMRAAGSSIFEIVTKSYFVVFPKVWSKGKKLIKGRMLESMNVLAKHTKCLQFQSWRAYLIFLSNFKISLNIKWNSFELFDFFPLKTLLELALCSTRLFSRLFEKSFYKFDLTNFQHNFFFANYA